MAKGDSDELVLDFSNVGPVPGDKECLTTVAAWEKGTSGAGNPKISARFKILEPEDLKGKVLFQEFSLQPNALFGIYNFFKAAFPEEALDKSYKLLPDDDYLGIQVAVRTAVRVDKTGQYADQTVIGKFSPASSYSG